MAVPPKIFAPKRKPEYKTNNIVVIKKERKQQNKDDDPESKLTFKRLKLRIKKQGKRPTKSMKKVNPKTTTTQLSWMSPKETMKGKTTPTDTTLTAKFVRLSG